MALTIDSPLVFSVAKALWDKEEAEYWDYEEDHRPFEPGKLIDGEPIADEWLAQVFEILSTAEKLGQES